MGTKGKANVQILGIKKKETNKEKVRRRSEDKKVKLVSHPSLFSAQYMIPFLSGLVGFGTFVVFVCCTNKVYTHLTSLKA